LYYAGNIRKSHPLSGGYSFVFLNVSINKKPVFFSEVVLYREMRGGALQGTISRGNQLFASPTSLYSTVCMFLSAINQSQGAGGQVGTDSGFFVVNNIELSIRTSYRVDRPFLLVLYRRKVTRAGFLDLNQAS
jgi:hypothetical protein